jgi:murein DD-endopeptidase MepM/ murein hydrolase activator NlpD
MPTSWGRAAAVLLCAGCAAGQAPGASARESVVREPAHPAAVRPAIVHLRLPALLLPSAGTVASQAVPRRESRHTVVPGDTLWAIAASAGVRVEALAAANGISENTVLRLGRVLTIPPPGAPVPDRLAVRPAAASVEAPAPPPAVSGARSPALLWPSRGVVTSRFGWRVHPIFGGREFHTGVDIATHYGSPVVAACTGVVRFVGWKFGYGRIIVLEHDGGFETAYSHLSAALVTSGQRVTEGQEIGRIGSSGWSTGPHLFFEVRRNGRPVDPASYLN